MFPGGRGARELRLNYARESFVVDRCRRAVCFYRRGASHCRRQELLWAILRDPSFPLLCPPPFALYCRRNYFYGAKKLVVAFCHVDCVERIRWKYAGTYIFTKYYNRSLLCSTKAYKAIQHQSNSIVHSDGDVASHIKQKRFIIRLLLCRQNFPEKSKYTFNI